MKEHSSEEHHIHEHEHCQEAGHDHSHHEHEHCREAEHSHHHHDHEHAQEQLPLLDIDEHEGALIGTVRCRIPGLSGISRHLSKRKTEAVCSP